MNVERSDDAVEILLVEDNPGDVRLIREAFKEAGRLNSRLHPVENGLEAIKFLRREERYSRAVRPGLIILDLNLPIKDGRDLLAEIKGDQNLRRIPVIVLSSSRKEEDVLKAYNLHANCYIIKPYDYSRFTDMVNAIEEFWLATVKLPPD